jgi:hypothetical protein
LNIHFQYIFLELEHKRIVEICHQNPRLNKSWVTEIGELKEKIKKLAVELGKTRSSVGDPSANEQFAIELIKMQG